MEPESVKWIHLEPIFAPPVRLRLLLLEPLLYGSANPCGVAAGAHQLRAARAEPAEVLGPLLRPNLRDPLTMCAREGVHFVVARRATRNEDAAGISHCSSNRMFADIVLAYAAAFARRQSPLAVVAG